MRHQWFSTRDTGQNRTAQNRSTLSHVTESEEGSVTQGHRLSRERRQGFRRCDLRAQKPCLSQNHLKDKFSQTTTAFWEEWKRVTKHTAGQLCVTGATVPGPKSHPTMEGTASPPRRSWDPEENLMPSPQARQYGRGAPASPGVATPQEGPSVLDTQAAGLGMLPSDWRGARSRARGQQAWLLVLRTSGVAGAEQSCAGTCARQEPDWALRTRRTQVLPSPLARSSLGQKAAALSPCRL